MSSSNGFPVKKRSWGTVFDSSHDNAENTESIKQDVTKDDEDLIIESLYNETIIESVTPVEEISGLIEPIPDSTKPIETVESVSNLIEDEEFSISAINPPLGKEPSVDEELFIIDPLPIEKPSVDEEFVDPVIQEFVNQSIQESEKEDSIEASLIESNDESVLEPEEVKSNTPRLDDVLEQVMPTPFDEDEQPIFDGTDAFSAESVEDEEQESVEDEEQESVEDEEQESVDIEDQSDVEDESKSNDSQQSGINFEFVNNLPIRSLQKEKVTIIEEEIVEPKNKDSIMSFLTDIYNSSLMNDIRVFFLATCVLSVFLFTLIFTLWEKCEEDFEILRNGPIVAHSLEKNEEPLEAKLLWSKIDDKAKSLLWLSGWGTDIDKPYLQLASIAYRAENWNSVIDYGYKSLRVPMTDIQAIYVQQMILTATSEIVKAYLPNQTEQPIMGGVPDHALPVCNTFSGLDTWVAPIALLFVSMLFLICGMKRSFVFVILLIPLYIYGMHMYSKVAVQRCENRLLFDPEYIQLFPDVVASLVKQPTVSDNVVIKE